MRADEQHRMVLQVLSDAGKVGAHRDRRAGAIVPPDRSRSASAASGTGSPPAAQDDFARHGTRGPHRPLRLSRRPHVDHRTRSPRPSRCGRMVRLRRARTCRVEIAERRGRTALRRIAHRQRAIAVAEVAVHVGDHRHLPRCGECVRAARERRPACRGRRGGSASARRGRAVRRRNRDRSRACGSTAARRSRPSRARRRIPFVVVVRRAAQRDHPHHARSAADDARLVEAGQPANWRGRANAPSAPATCRTCCSRTPDRHRGCPPAPRPAACRCRLRAAARNCSNAPTGGLPSRSRPSRRRPRWCRTTPAHCWTSAFVHRIRAAAKLKPRLACSKRAVVVCERGLERCSAANTAS